MVVFGVGWRTRVSRRVESLADGTKPPPDERWCGRIPVGKGKQRGGIEGGVHQLTGHSASLIRRTDQRRSLNNIFFVGKIKQTRFSFYKGFQCFLGNELFSKFKRLAG